ncbi:hypothetical protein PGT21_005788 [Puccinia graminis f. sp. tritici]|uniref:Uncharacterized protein n=1 Tax=Puccinia graminis f. sp. tritici TaxID=56615 RepID=A0A5B0M4E0_PUCGR|nr:hypothetical protein PGT21_005788 [Puccinia graminis f. sp. tritici]
MSHIRSEPNSSVSPHESVISSTRYTSREEDGRETGKPFDKPSPRHIGPRSLQVILRAVSVTYDRKVDKTDDVIRAQPTTTSHFQRFLSHPEYLSQFIVRRPRST